MKALRLGLIAVLIAPVMAGIMATAKPAEAAVTTGNLGNLIVLNGLFGGANAGQLAGLIAVDNATGGGFGGGGISGNNLGDLIVLNGLFNGGGFGFGGSNLSGLAGLIAVSNLTGSGI